MNETSRNIVINISSSIYHNHIFIGNFTHPTKYPCIGCQDGYLTQHLVRSKRWTYTRLPIDGLKSIIFHGPSPTLCIASGDYDDV